MFVKKFKEKFVIVQIYVDDIIFRGMSEEMVELFVKQIEDEFEMSMAGELSYFLRFQIKQLYEGVFIS